MIKFFNHIRKIIVTVIICIGLIIFVSISKSNGAKKEVRHGMSYLSKIWNVYKKDVKWQLKEKLKITGLLYKMIKLDCLKL